MHTVLFAIKCAASICEVMVHFLTQEIFDQGRLDV